MEAAYAHRSLDSHAGDLLEQFVRHPERLPPARLGSVGGLVSTLHASTHDTCEDGVQRERRLRGEVGHRLADEAYEAGALDPADVVGAVGQLERREDQPLLGLAGRGRREQPNQHVVKPVPRGVKALHQVVATAQHARRRRAQQGRAAPQLHKHGQPDDGRRVGEHRAQALVGGVRGADDAKAAVELGAEPRQPGTHFGNHADARLDEVERLARHAAVLDLGQLSRRAQEEDGRGVPDRER